MTPVPQELLDLRQRVANGEVSFIEELKEAEIAWTKELWRMNAEQ